MIQILVVDVLGIFIGNVGEKNEAGNLPVTDAMLFGPSEKGGMSFKKNPLLGDPMEINPSYIVAKSSPSAAILEKYEEYLVQVRTGLITKVPPGAVSNPKGIIK